MRGIRQDDIDCPDKLKQEIFTQCGSGVVPKPAEMELGYFVHSKKLWINNRLDLNDAWEILGRGGSLTFWCVGSDGTSRPAENRKRTKEQQDSSTDEEDPQKKAKKNTKQEERKAIADDYESKLRQKHQDAYTRFQYKLWAEMLAAGVHTDLNAPPAASVWSRKQTHFL